MSHKLLALVTVTLFACSTTSSTDTGTSQDADAQMTSVDIQAETGATQQRVASTATTRNHAMILAMYPGGQLRRRQLRRDWLPHL